MVKAKEVEVVAVRGPLGLWPFPILNVLVQLILVLRVVYQQPSAGRAGIRTYQFVRDEKGRIIEIVEVER